MPRETRSAEELLRAVAERTAQDNFGGWYWGDAIAIDGLLDASHALDEPVYAHRVQRVALDWCARKTVGDLAWVDFLAPAVAILEVAQTLDQADCLTVARKLGELMLAAPRTADGVPLHRGDLPDRRNWAWIDTTYHEPAFLCRLGRVLEEPRFVDAGAEVLLAHARTLRDRATGFYHHAYDAGARRLSGTLWGRGQGWILLGLADTLRELPREHSAHPQVASLLGDLVDRLAEAQDATGFWHTVVDERNSHLETSLCGFVLAAVAQMEARWRQPAWENMARAAWAALRERVSPDGAVLGVTVEVPARFDNPQHYRDRPLGFSAWGQGAFLRAAAAVCRGDLPGIAGVDAG